MGNLSIEAKILAGTNVKAAIEEALWLAGKIGSTIEINFNGCSLRIHFCDKISAKVKEYEQWLEESKKPS